MALSPSAARSNAAQGPRPARVREGGASGPGRFRVSAQTSEYPASCVTIRKCEPEAGARRGWKPRRAYGKCESSEFPAAIDLESLPPPASPWAAVPACPPAPLGSRPLSESGKARGGGFCPRPGTAPAEPCSEARLSWPGLGATRNPDVLAARSSLTVLWRGGRGLKKKRKNGTMEVSPLLSIPGSPPDSPHCTIPSVELPRDSEPVQERFPGLPSREGSSCVSRPDPGSPSNCTSSGDWVAL